MLIAAKQQVVVRLEHVRSNRDRGESGEPRARQAAELECEVAGHDEGDCGVMVTVIQLCQSSLLRGFWTFILRADLVSGK